MLPEGQGGLPWENVIPPETWRVSKVQEGESTAHSRWGKACANTLKGSTAWMTQGKRGKELWDQAWEAEWEMIIQGLVDACKGMDGVFVKSFKKC